MSRLSTCCRASFSLLFTSTRTSQRQSRVNEHCRAPSPPSPLHPPAPSATGHSPHTPSPSTPEIFTLYLTISYPSLTPDLPVVLEELCVRVIGDVELVGVKENVVGEIAGAQEFRARHYGELWAWLIRVLWVWLFLISRVGGKVAGFCLLFKKAANLITST